MFKLVWRRKAFDYVTGLSRYCSVEAAQRQAQEWKDIFPNNRYYIMPA